MMDKLAMGSSKIVGKIGCVRVERKLRKMLYFVKEGVSVAER